MRSRVKPLILFAGATRYDTPCSLCVAAMRGPGFGAPARRFQPIPVIDPRGGPLVGMTGLLRQIVGRCARLPPFCDASSPHIPVPDFFCDARDLADATPHLAKVPIAVRQTGPGIHDQGATTRLGWYYGQFLDDHGKRVEIEHHLSAGGKLR